METTSLERAVIGLALHDQRTLLDLDRLTPAHFADTTAAAVWWLITSMAAHGEGINAQTVLANVGRIREQHHRATGEWLLGAMRLAPVSALAEQYAAKLVNAYQLRALQQAAREITETATTATDAPAAIEHVRGIIDEVTPASVRGSLLADHLYESIARFDEPATAIPTPWLWLNQVIGGWRPGGLYVIGARPGAGKSMWAIQSALHLARRGPVAFNTLEMSVHEVNQRIIAHAANVHLGRLQGVGDGMKPLTEDDRALIGQAAPEIVNLPLSIRDDRSVTVTGIRAHARSLSRQGPLAGIVVDYLQLLRTEAGERRPRHEIVADYSRALKNLAGEMDCPVLALSQLNRGAAGSSPSLANLRESGALEQDADVVILLSLPEDRDDDGNVTVDEGKLIVEVAKNRHGAPGRLTLARIGAKSTIGTRGELAA